MDYNLLLQLKDRANKVKTDLPPEVAASFNDSFNVEYAHNSTAIEGNTLTLIQTKAVIEDGLSVGGKTLREIYEVANHAKAFAYVQKCVTDKKPLDENTVKDIHALLMHDIIAGGVYRMIECKMEYGSFQNCCTDGTNFYGLDDCTEINMRGCNSDRKDWRREGFDSELIM